MFFVLFLLFLSEHGTESRQELLQVEQPDVGLSSYAVSALIVGRVGDEIWNITASFVTFDESKTVQLFRSNADNASWVHTRVIRLHEAKRSVVDGDGEETEVVRVAHACRHDNKHSGYQ